MSSSQRHDKDKCRGIVCMIRIKKRYNKSLKPSPKMQLGSHGGRLPEFFGSDAAGRLNSMLASTEPRAERGLTVVIQ
jgi:hypothetical protein